MFYTDVVSAPVRSGDKEITVLPRHTKVIVTGNLDKVSLGRSAGCCQEICCSWRLALAGSEVWCRSEVAEEW